LLAVIRQLRSRHPSAGKNDKKVALNDGAPTAPQNNRREQSQSPRRFKQVDPEGKYVLDTVRGKVRSWSRMSSPGSGRGRSGSASSNTQRRPSKSPNRVTGTKIDIASLGVNPGECAKCGTRGHLYTEKACPLYTERLTERCPACKKGGHKSEVCPRVSSGQN